MIRLQNLHKYFNKGSRNEIHVINDISVELPEKGMVAFFGQSGCGKTTLLNVIGGLDDFASGSIEIDGKSIKKDADTVRNQEIGYIFQNYNLHKNETCFNNVAAALRLCGMTDKGQIEARVSAALANVGMEKYSNRIPDTLSGGQQQRIAIARAIVKNPRIILADEPTGNLDEANTIMIMDLLKAISKDHLVLLVTHEANLVDFYCGKILELSDGRIMNIRDNDSATGLVARDKNKIYLGELEKSETANEHTQIEYYGEKPEEPIKLRIVNNGGKLYLQIGSEKVQLLDNSSEIKLCEGVYEEKPKAEGKNADVDMSKLPPFRGTRFGKLFTTKSALKSGYNENFRVKKKGNKLLKACMFLFAVVIVIVGSMFGTAVKKLNDADNAYNHNVFYVYTPNGDVSQKLNNAVTDPNTGIEFIKLIDHSYGDFTISLQTPSFESFDDSAYGNNFKTNAVLLSVSLADKLSLDVGKKNISNNEMLITTKVADALVKKSSLGYIKERKDLIGMYTENGNLTYDDKGIRIAGIVKSNESAAYLTDIALVDSISTICNQTTTALGKKYDATINKGETTIYVTTDKTVVDLPKVGETIQIQGIDLKVTNIETKIMESAPHPVLFLLNDEDYIQTSKQIGKTHPAAFPIDSAQADEEDDEKDPIDTFIENLDITFFTAVYSTNIAKTTMWLNAEFSDLEPTEKVTKTIITPSDMYNEIIKDSKRDITSKVVFLVISLAVMSLCMYFIMHSSLMNRIKEVGIYRAIGVSKKNIIFRFFIEAVVLTTLTVFVGFFISSSFMGFVTKISSVVSSTFYYPLWLAIAVLFTIYAISLICGIIPVFMLLRKTPSQILSKYDI